ncbi:hypothetical protein HNR60_003382 [Rhodopseudomonas rhenobacensis]|uniref:Uncharacterized protein n=1 Tax=Rhodopseudomonas rhenobacensis TaxID=87461 RepID=A0A7W7Z605_9BRAD|nr:hypothetical protein [Rhodopseudomonas rhenobacensis]
MYAHLLFVVVSILGPILPVLTGLTTRFPLNFLHKIS